MYKVSRDNLYTTIMLRLEIVSHFATLAKATDGGLTPVTLRAAAQHRLTLTLTSLPLSPMGKLPCPSFIEACSSIQLSDWLLSSYPMGVLLCKYGNRGISNDLAMGWAFWAAYAVLPKWEITLARYRRIAWGTDRRLAWIRWWPWGHLVLCSPGY